MIDPLQRYWRFLAGICDAVLELFPGQAVAVARGRDFDVAGKQAADALASALDDPDDGGEPLEPATPGWLTDTIAASEAFAAEQVKPWLVYPHTVDTVTPYTTLGLNVNVAIAMLDTLVDLRPIAIDLNDWEAWVAHATPRLVNAVAAAAKLPTDRTTE